MRKTLVLAACLVLALLSRPLLALEDPQALAALKAVTAEKYPDTEAVVVLDETHVDVEDSGLSHVNKTQLVKVLTEAGAAKYVALRFDYDPASSYAEVKKLTVYRADGAIEQIPQAGVRDLPQPQEMIYWGPRMKLAAIPKLNPGDAVKIETYSKGFVIAYLAGEEGDEKYIPPMRGHYYDVVLFQGDNPIVKKSYTIVLPKNKPLRAEVFHGELASSASFDEKSLTYSWWKENVPAIKREPRMVEDTDAMPKLVLATVQTWPDKSRWFFHANEDVHTFAFNDDIKKKVDEITKGLKTDDEKRFALLAWVARQIRYSGISMGKGEGYTLHPGIMDYNDRCGVCKDIAGTLVTFFRAAGYKTYPAMTMAGAKVENIPADQFNHCVVAVEIAPDQYKMYDPTWCPFSREIWSSAEKPQNYVIGSPRGEELMETPEAPPSDNFLRVQNDGSLDEQGNLQGTVSISAGHYTEVNLAWAVVNSEASSLQGMFEQWISRLSPSAELVSWETTDVVDVTKPFRITLKYKVPGYAAVESGRMVFTPPMARNILHSRRLVDFQQAVKGKNRTYDIFLRATRQYDFVDNVTLPAGYALKGSPEYKKVDGPTAAFKAEAAVKNGALAYSEQVIIKKKIVPAAEYGNLKDAVEALNDSSDGFVIVGR